MDKESGLSREAAQKIVGAADADAALLYLYLSLHNDPAQAEASLGMTMPQLRRAAATLRQLGILPSPPIPVERTPEKPQYTEADVLARGEAFTQLVQEAQRRLGRILSTEELKILLSFVDYLGLSMEVIALLITYCTQKNLVRGVHRAPSIRTVEKEAYYWADHGIDTLEEAAAYTQQQLRLLNRIEAVKKALQLEERRLTLTEEGYIRNWLELGFGNSEIHLAYEKSCVNVGCLKWTYMNSILKSWHGKHLHTVEEIKAGDSAPKAGSPRRQEPDSNDIKAAYAKLLAQEEE